ncbi:MAG: MerR family transcriptional regulator [Candidatus Moduliflexus flocculans]|nr:MerR family transcriptional regulator [Candidatus Moduliflexus flocculans]
MRSLFDRRRGTDPGGEAPRYPVLGAGRPPDLPRRSESGRREYSEAELLAFLRVKHLVRRRGLSPEAAREVLLREASGPRQDLRARACEIRSLLVRAYFLSARGLP